MSLWQNSTSERRCHLFERFERLEKWEGVTLGVTFGVTKYTVQKRNVLIGVTFGVTF